MISGKMVIAWIPARGGSKGIKDKNIYLLNNKPLIAYTIEAALKLLYVDLIMVSTDDKRIADISRKYGAWVPSLRPTELAGDMSQTIDAVLYSLKLLKQYEIESDIFCLLQPTSPLRDEIDIDRALELYIEKGQAVVGVSKVQNNPLLIRNVSPDGEAIPLLKMKSTCRRQDMPCYYHVNGSIYINSSLDIDENTSFNDNPIAFKMETSHGIDIDEVHDMVVAEYYLQFNGSKRNG